MMSSLKRMIVYRSILEPGVRSHTRFLAFKKRKVSNAQLATCDSKKKDAIKQTTSLTISFQLRSFFELLTMTPL